MESDHPARRVFAHARQPGRGRSGRYAAVHAQAYGEAVDAVTLIPHMLEAFMAGDRGFRKGGVSKAPPPKSN
ncbi:DUF2274 domain-containing protein [Pseudomonas sp. CA3A]|uniref:DUF2274 domain-containing protein n=1 Tax=Pseudomonas typographi TaxID=2715964 RepID=A0ABR7Z619_9PSED|nr:DUF2274 domain-containing protein [Pseudomonas typographi]